MILQGQNFLGSLLIAGDGSFKNYCVNLSKQLNLQNVYFVGKVQFENAFDYYTVSDIFVLPSCLRGQPEAWGLTINEAMSLNLPIITTDAVGAFKDLVINGFNGYVVRNCYSFQLYKALKELLNDKDKNKSMGKNSRKIFDIFNSYEKMFKGFRNAIDLVSTN
jgi:glycosyltransferase involved in cell wall biosynthesis